MKKNGNTPDYRHGTFTLATTSILQFEYDEFVDAWKDTHPDTVSVPSKDSDEFWDWAADERDVNWEQDLENIEECERYNVPCVITGELGLWDGNHDIVPVVKKSVISALKKIFRNDCDDYDITYEDGRIKVRGHHHDGTNVFVISALSKKGWERAMKAKESWNNFFPAKGDTKRLPYLYAIGV